MVSEKYDATSEVLSLSEKQLLGKFYIREVLRKSLYSWIEKSGNV